MHVLCLRQRGNSKMDGPVLTMKMELEDGWPYLEHENATCRWTGCALSMKMELDDACTVPAV